MLCALLIKMIMLEVFMKKNNFKSNEIINDTVRLYTLATNGEIMSCSTNYYVEEYNFFDWVLHYLKD